MDARRVHCAHTQHTQTHKELPAPVPRRWMDANHNIDYSNENTHPIDSLKQVILWKILYLRIVTNKSQVQMDQRPQRKTNYI